MQSNRETRKNSFSRREPKGRKRSLENSTTANSKKKARPNNSPFVSSGNAMNRRVASIKVFLNNPESQRLYETMQPIATRAEIENAMRRKMNDADFSKNIRKIMANSIAKHIHMVSPNNFKSHVDRALEYLRKSFPRDQPYALIVEAGLRSATSTMFLAPQLRRALPPPSMYIVVLKNHVYDPVAMQAIKSALARGIRHFVYFDDAWYSGNQAADYLTMLFNDALTWFKQQKYPGKVHVWALAIMYSPRGLLTVEQTMRALSRGNPIVFHKQYEDAALMSTYNEKWNVWNGTNGYHPFTTTILPIKIANKYSIGVLSAAAKTKNANAIYKRIPFNGSFAYSEINRSRTG